MEKETDLSFQSLVQYNTEQRSDYGREQGLTRRTGHGGTLGRENETIEEADIMSQELDSRKGLDATMQNTPATVNEEGEPDQSEQQPLIPKNSEPIDCRCIGPCIKCCTKGIFKHPKVCAIAAIVLAVIFLLFIGFLGVTIHYYISNTPNTTTLYIAPQTVMEVDLWEYNMDTLHQLNITVVENSQYKGIMEFAVSHEPTRSLKTTTFEFSLQPHQPESLLRQWTSSTNHLIEIKVGEPVYMDVKWSNLKNINFEKNQTEHCIGKISNNTSMNATEINQTWPHDNSTFDLALVTFCSSAYTTVHVNIKEYLPWPKRNSYKLLFVNEEDISQRNNSVIVEFPFLSELTKRSKLYINTRHLKTIDDTYHKIQIQVSSQSTWYWGIVPMSVALLLTVLCAAIALFILWNRRVDFVTMGYYTKK